MSAIVQAVTADDVNAEHRLARQSAENAVQHAIRCGELLVAKKAELKHGEFTPWIESNCEFPQSTASIYIKAAQQNSNGLEISSLRGLFPSGRKEVKREGALGRSCDGHLGHVVPTEHGCAGDHQDDDQRVVDRRVVGRGAHDPDVDPGHQERRDAGDDAVPTAVPTDADASSLMEALVRELADACPVRRLEQVKRLAELLDVTHHFWVDIAARDFGAIAERIATKRDTTLEPIIKTLKTKGDNAALIGRYRIAKSNATKCRNQLVKAEKDCSEAEALLRAAAEAEERAP